MNQEEKEILKEEIIQELQHANLKKEIINELSDRNENGKDIFKHPAVLIILSFFCTTAIGAVLTSYYKNKEFNNQQKILFQEKLINKRIDISSSISFMISSTVKVANDFVRINKFDSRAFHAKSSEIDSIRNDWIKASSSWRISKYNLRAQLSIYFDDLEVIYLFDDIINIRKSKIGVPMLNLWDVNFANLDVSSKKNLDEKCSEILKGCEDLLSNYEKLELKLNREIRTEIESKIENK